MGRYLAGRALQSSLVLLALSFVAFGLLHLAPGDPAALLYGPDATAADLAQVRERWGLDRPLPAQYLAWLGHALRGDLGRSLTDGRPVSETIGERLPATILLAVPALLLALTLGVSLGMGAAVRAGSPLDRALTLLATLGYSTPSFWLALLLILLLSLTWRWLPSGGLSSPGGSASPLDVAAHLLLPATVLALPFVAQFQRFSRAALVEVLGQGYVRTARAKGLGTAAVLVGHALRNAALPILTLLALVLPQLLSGAVVVETVFAWPGLGRLMVESAFQRNYSVLMGDILLVGGLVVAANLLADLAYPLVDPRIRRGGR
jgi:peptide/nickel transport system permease protein